jgi:histidyl-tRNA synthetase
LVKLVSGGKVDLPALGFGMGDVVLLELLKARGLLPKFSAALEVFFLIEDEALRQESLKLVHELRSAGCAVDYPLVAAKSDKQFKRALECHAACTIRLVRTDAGELVAKLRSLKAKREKDIAAADLARLVTSLKDFIQAP